MEPINSNVCCRQMGSLNEYIIQKCREFVNHNRLVFCYDNMRPHTSLITHQKLLERGWVMLPHLPCWPDLTPSYFNLLCSLQNFLCGVTFKSDETVNQHLQFFAENDRSFYVQVIMKLTDRWQKVIEQNGQCITD